ncbi:MAG TPA: hypothetical protein VFY39_06700 [Gammaproteobacteria bacterium]|nr:hypothetical protein [Gammaproteobacteria bacterium]
MSYARPDQNVPSSAVPAEISVSASLAPPPAATSAAVTPSVAGPS